MVRCGTGLVMCMVVFAISFLMSFPPAEICIGLTEEFCVGKSELRGKESMSFSLQKIWREVGNVSSLS